MHLTFQENSMISLKTYPFRELPWQFVPTPQKCLKPDFFHCLLISPDYNMLRFSLFPRVTLGKCTEKKKEKSFFLI